MTGALEVVEVTGSVLIEDLGRPGRSHLGVSPSGAADRGALVAANRMLGNPPGSAGLEIMGAARFRAGADLLLALAGAPTSVTLDGVPAADVVLSVRAGTEVAMAAPHWGLRSYLALVGGIDVPEVLGSRSTDVLSGLGPEPVQAGDLIRAGRVSGHPRTSDPGARRPPSGALVMLDTTPGPRADWLAEPEQLFARPWRVSRLADRVGTRLEGQPLARAIEAELPSEGVVRGSVQLPPGGEPVILGPDHPTTGGYPVVAVLTELASDTLAQLPAGTTVRFRRSHR